VTYDYLYIGTNFGNFCMIDGEVGLSDLTTEYKNKKMEIPNYIKDESDIDIPSESDLESCRGLKFDELSDYQSIRNICLSDK